MLLTRVEKGPDKSRRIEKGKKKKQKRGGPGIVEFPG
jgi:hypothetical protein